MNWLMELLELLNGCTPLRAAAYMFFITITSYIVLYTTFSGLTDIIFVLRGYGKPDKEENSIIGDEDTKQILND